MYDLANASLTTSTSTLTTSTNALSGRGLIHADRPCQYNTVVQAGDVLRVDFDTITVRKSGLSLFEDVNSDGVGWMGYRRFGRNINGVSMGESGRGDWRELPSLSGAGLRVAGFVE